jgi:UDP-N-acetylglucosamine 2-epimerase (non-hydrolysing)
MIDSLSYTQRKYNIEELLTNLIGNLRSYVFLTLHRPSNVDDMERWGRISKSLKLLSVEFPIIVSSHPRSSHLFEELNFVKLLKGIGYKESIALQSFAAFVVTDSGGLQEETTYLNIPCLTLRDNTERPETVMLGTNTLVSPEELMNYPLIIELINVRRKNERIPLWDGNASERIVNNFIDFE